MTVDEITARLIELMQACDQSGNDAEDDRLETFLDGLKGNGVSDRDAARACLRA